MTLYYPAPDNNPACQCKGKPIKAFFCEHGHMLECHHPYTCNEAACSHLEKYDYSPEQIELMDAQARANIAAGLMPPYALDEHGNIIVSDSAAAPIPDGIRQVIDDWCKEQGIDAPVEARELVARRALMAQRNQEKKQ